MTAENKDTVVLLHGIGHTRWNMWGVEKRLRRHGFDVVNISYSSLRYGLDDLSDKVWERLAREGVWEKGGRVHFVTHSMGGLVARRLLGRYRAQIKAGRLGRVVMIAPPQGGSEIADLLHRLPPYRWLYGPAGQELTTTARQKADDPLYYEAAVIAGTKGRYYPVANLFFPGGACSHDGRVAVARAGHPGLAAFATVDATHSFISWRGDVQDMAASFLATGRLFNN